MPAIAKRPRPSFKPPRPMSKDNSTSEPAAKKPKTKKSPAVSKAKISKSKSSKRSAARVTASDDENEDDENLSAISETPPPSPRPSTSKKSKKSASNTRRQPSLSPLLDDSRSPSPNFILAEIIHHDRPTDSNGDETGATLPDLSDNQQILPPKLLKTLLALHWKHDKTSITKDALKVVEMYVNVFAREAIARAAFEKTGGGAGEGSVRGRVDAGSRFLEVEDLEKIAPQIAMDF